jgi:mannitol-1-phosphate 5-dehydrogenase
MAGGFLAPVLDAAGWEVILASRDRAVCAAINEHGGVWLRPTGAEAQDRWFGGVRSVTLDDPELPRLAAGADLFATSVGPSSLASAGRRLAPLLRARVDASSAPVNVLTIENHRRAPELLAEGLLGADASLAGAVGRRLGIGGTAAWRLVSRREITPRGLVFHGDEVAECYVDGTSLIREAAPLDGSVPGLEPVEPFERYMAEKLWVFNAGHATAAYLGWLVGCATIEQAMGRPEIRATVASVVSEAQQCFHLSRAWGLGATPARPRPLEWILARYEEPGLDDPVTRVGREPRRKLSAGDRFIGPAVASLAVGIRPLALATGAAAALAYGESTDRQAMDLRHELELLGPEEVLGTVGTLSPHEELTRLICERYRELGSSKALTVEASR